MTRFNVATCRNCGAEFSPPLVGQTTDLCPQCRQGAEPQPQRVVPRRLSASELIRMFPATSILIGLNVLVYVAMVAKGLSPTNPTTDQLLRWGADHGPLTLGAQPWRALSSCFVHDGFLHLLFNMWCLWSLGVFVERFLGRGTYVVAYLLAGVGGAIASVWWHPLVVGVGASGAIFGLAGIMVTLLRSGQLSLPAEYLKRHSKSILAFIGYNLFFGFISAHIDNSAHLGGLATGLLMGAMLPIAGSEERSSRRALAFGVTAALLFGAFTYARHSRLPELALARGLQAVDAKQYDRAVTEFKAALQQDPKLAEAYFGLAYVYMEQEKYADAVSVLEQATRLAPNEASGFAGLGLAYARSGRAKDAEAPLARAVQLQPRDADSWYDIALAYADMGKVTEAKHAAQQALNIDPKNAGARQVLEQLQENAPAPQPKAPGH